MNEEISVMADTPAIQVMKAIRFERPDYLPFWDNFWGDFPAKWSRYMGLPATANPDDYYGRCVHEHLGDEKARKFLEKKISGTES